MLPGMIEIDDLNGSRKVNIGEVPNPDGAIGDHNPESCPFPTSTPSFRINAKPELLGGFDRASVGGGVCIADGSALVVDCGLREETVEFAFARMGALPLYFSGLALVL